MLKHIVSVLFGMIVSMSAAAHPGHDPGSMGKDSIDFSISTPFTDSHLPALVVKAVHGNTSAMQLIKEDYMGDKPWLVFHHLHHIDHWSESPIPANDKSYFMAHLIKHKFPQARQYWRDTHDWNDITVHLSATLINPEVVPVSQAQMEEKQGKRTTYLEATPFIESATFAMTNRHRMRTGLPAIGPDNRPMVLCRLLRDRDAPYYELAQSDARDLIIETQSGMSLDQACLTQTLTKGYWKLRARDFETRYGEELPAH